MTDFGHSIRITTLSTAKTSTTGRPLYAPVAVLRMYTTLKRIESSNLLTWEELFAVLLWWKLDTTRMVQRNERIQNAPQRIEGNVSKTFFALHRKQRQEARCGCYT